MVKQYLTEGEQVIHSSDSSVTVAGMDNFRVFLTGSRIIFHRKKGIIFRKDTAMDLLLKYITGATVEENGILRKRSTLRLKGGGADYEITGRRKEIRILHSRINSMLTGNQR